MPSIAPATASVVDHHAGLAQRESGEHPERESGNEGRDVAVEDDDEDYGGNGEEDDAVGEHELVPAVGQLAGQYPLWAMIDDRPGKPL